MSTIISEMEADSPNVSALRDASIPKHRQAYSDRTAWLMACLSEMAYLRFNYMFSGDADKYFFEKIQKVLSETRSDKVRDLITSLAYDPSEERERLERGLSLLGFTLEETFDEEGTQAILVSCEEFIAIAFRETEATSIKDIKADAYAVTKEAKTEGQIHSGFDSSLRNIEGAIQSRLNSGLFDSAPLFLTGHSLGGALATLAAKRLTHRGGLAACYTFGAPRVGDEEWIAALKTPVYRLVNAADCVTMLPPGAVAIRAISWIVKWVPRFGPSLKRWLVERFGGYMHAGNMRYLTNCRSGQYSAVKLLYSVSFVYRIKGFIMKSLPWRKFLADHSIAIYRKKLMVVAESRNQIAIT